jgi:hypothetical protein
MRRRLLICLTVVAVVAAAAVVGWRELVSTVTDNTPMCTLGAGDNAVDYEFEQAADASTIAAVAKRRGLADHAVTIALAAALQESKLYNVESGDRDSIGIFQQRPSQGWGSPTQLHDPAYAANAFFSHLEKIGNWPSLPIATAAQLVQRSADGTAYAQWEEQAHVLARALTGELPGGLTCAYRDHQPAQTTALVTAARTQIGSSFASGGVNTQQDWSVAEWLVAHSYDYGVVAVSVRGHRWSNTSGKWKLDSKAGAAPTYLLAKPATNS